MGLRYRLDSSHWVLLDSECSLFLSMPFLFVRPGILGPFAPHHGFTGEFWQQHGFYGESRKHYGFTGECGSSGWKFVGSREKLLSALWSQLSSSCWEQYTSLWPVVSCPTTDFSSWSIWIDTTTWNCSRCWGHWWWYCYNLPQHIWSSMSRDTMFMVVWLVFFKYLILYN